MGIAEVVPGVSGGTIAFVTGIYQELLGSLASFGGRSLRTLFTEGSRRFWFEHNLSFLALLGLGMALSVVLFARLIAGWLESAPPLVWGFFCGLIMASVVHIGRARSIRLLITYGALGLLIGLLMLLLDPLARQDSLWVFFFGGMVAVCAWLLPGVSGSFLLLIMGLYAPVLEAINELNLVVLMVLAAGCVVGLLSFSKGLHWLMMRHGEALLALLTGFIAGSLPRLWPWTVDGALLSPATYELLSEQSAFFPWVWVTVLAGAVSLWLLSRFE
ncbi:MAG: DUF368 domain-containing protein [Gammaproteobacteria bacterium]|nr:DUF368 domain-containing protein [Gammaproteobacteria bacterium]